METEELDALIVRLRRDRGFLVTESGCVEYQGYRNDNGYGQFRQGKLLRVHRLVYEWVYGPFEGEVLHLCDNPPCCNPAHLRHGTHRDNLQDMWGKGRGYKQAWTHCPNGHEYTEENVSAGSNKCKQCTRERNRRYNDRKRDQRG